MNEKITCKHEVEYMTVEMYLRKRLKEMNRVEYTGLKVTNMQTNITLWVLWRDEETKNK